MKFRSAKPARYNPKEDADQQNALILRAVINLVTVVTILVAFGLVMLYSASYGRAGMKFFSNQLIWVGLGLTGAATVFVIGYRRMAELSLIWIILSFLALIS